MKDLVTLVASLRPFSSVLVTGPQRSGTKITAKVLAAELGYEYVPEQAIIVRDGPGACAYDDVDLAKKALGNGRVVLQAPALSYVAHTFQAAIVFCRRDVSDIIASQKRFGWHCEKYELSKYNLAEGVIAEVKYRVWDDWQRRACAASFDLQYEWLRGHRLWIDEDKRHV